MKLLLILVVIICYIIIISASDCKATIAGAEFDLSSYVNDPYHEVIDLSIVSGERGNATYYFNFCKESSYPRFAEECRRTGSEEYGWSMDPAMAFRHDNTNDHCNRLSGQPNMSNIIFSPYDASNVAIGVIYTTTHGDTICFFKNNQGECLGTARLTFFIGFICADSYEEIPKEIHVSNPIPTQYGFYFSSSAGCPTVCPRINGLVCHGHGTCNFDKTEGKTRCFCNRKYAGDSCQKVESTVFTSSTTAFMSVTIVLLILVIAFVYNLLIIYYYIVHIYSTD